MTHRIQHPERRRNHLLTSFAAIAVATAWLAMAGCASAQSSQAATTSPMNDQAITEAVKSLFLDNPLVDGRAIRVETKNATVLLTGSAGSHIEKATASELTLGVSGVRLVQNEITVRQ
jgi:osmotically-inducible protein OsmY